MKNRRYIGEYTYRDIVVPEGIPAIVPQDLFDRVQDKLAKNKLPAEFHLTGLVCDVNTAFNAATTNTLTLGTATDEDAYMTASDIAAGTPGAYTVAAFAALGANDVAVSAKYSQTGDAATAGNAQFWAKVARLA